MIINIILSKCTIILFSILELFNIIQFLLEVIPFEKHTGPLCHIFSLFVLSITQIINLLLICHIKFGNFLQFVLILVVIMPCVKPTLFFQIIATLILTKVCVCTTVHIIILIQTWVFYFYP